MLIKVTSGATPLKPSVLESAAAVMIPATKVPCASQSWVAVTGEHVVASGHHIGQPAVSRNAGVDDRDPLARTAGELPDTRQIEICELIPAWSRVPVTIVQTSRCTVGFGGAGNAGLGSHLSSICGGETACADGVPKYASSTDTAARARRARCLASCRMQTADGAVEAAYPTGQGHHRDEDQTLEQLDTLACDG